MARPTEKEQHRGWLAPQRRNSTGDGSPHREGTAAGMAEGEVLKLEAEKVQEAGQWKDQHALRALGPTCIVTRDPL